MLWALVLVGGLGAMCGCRAKPAVGEVPAQLHQRTSETGVSVRVTYGVEALPLAWAPDSSRVAVGVWTDPIPPGKYVQDLEPNRLAILDAETGRATAELPCPIKGAVWPPWGMVDWKRDSRHILAYTVPRDMSGRYYWLFRADVESGETQYVRGGAYYGHPWECPHGDRYALYDYANSCLRLYEGSGRPQGVVFMGQVRGVVWIDAEELVVDGDPGFYGAGGRGLYLVRIGSAPVRLCGQRWVLPLAPSPLYPVGGLVPAIDRRGGTAGVAVGTVQVHTRAIESLTDPNAAQLYASYAALALDGEVVLFLRGGHKGSDLWAVRVADRVLVPVTNEKGVGVFTVSPDGRRVAYARKERDLDSVWIMTLDKEAILSAPGFYQ